MPVDVAIAQAQIDELTLRITEAIRVSREKQQYVKDLQDERLQIQAELITALQARRDARQE